MISVVLRESGINSALTLISAALATSLARRDLNLYLDALVLEACPLGTVVVHRLNLVTVSCNRFLWREAGMILRMGWLCVTMDDGGLKDNNRQRLFGVCSGLP